MGELPLELEKTWANKHKKDAELAFQDIRDHGRNLDGPVGPSFFAKAADEKETPTTPTTKGVGAQQPVAVV